MRKIALLLLVSMFVSGNVKIVAQAEIATDKQPLLFIDGIEKPYSMLLDTVLLKKENMESMRVLKEATATTIYGEKGKNGAVLIKMKEGLSVRESSNESEEPYSGVEQMPQFQGGEEALAKFIGKNLRYPKNELLIDGRNTIRFTITSTGEVTDVVVLQSYSPAFDAEAIRVVKLMPKWIPGRQNGKNVPVYYTLPMVYKHH